MPTVRTFTIDSSRFSDVEGFYDEISQVFGFPDYFGRNLDALSDCLSDIEVPCRIVWRGSKKSAAELGSFFDSAMEVFQSESSLILE